MKHDYSVQIAWSEEDQAYLARVAELPGCMADGSTREEALANIKVIAAEWVKVANEEARPIPKPMSAEDLEAAQRKFREGVNKEIQRGVNQAVNQAVQQVVEQATEQAVKQLKEFLSDLNEREEYPNRVRLVTT
jgi:predicted RNase H-like HicB family nuclease